MGTRTVGVRAGVVPSADLCQAGGTPRSAQRLLAFVTEVTTPGGPGYVTPSDRIAVFDDDGTLWPEKPRAQGMFALQRLRSVAGEHPEWQTQHALQGGARTRQQVPAGGQRRGRLPAGRRRLRRAARRKPSGRKSREFFATARHPRFERPYTQLAYGPMRELISHLKANGFRVFISTTGSIDLVRVLAEDLYGIPADDVLGSSVVSTLREEDGRLVLRRLATVHALNDGPVKPLDLRSARGPAPDPRCRQRAAPAATSTCSATASSRASRTCRC